jgi:hypothetical protein
LHSLQKLQVDDIGRLRQFLDGGMEDWKIKNFEKH